MQKRSSTSSADNSHDKSAGNSLRNSQHKPLGSALDSSLGHPSGDSQESSADKWVKRLRHISRIAETDPVAARFIYSLRLIALHERARRDPVPELAVRLGNIAAATRALELATTLSMVWPERLLVSRFCCDFLTHDEATIASLVEAAQRRDQSGFKEVLAGLMRHDRIPRLWQSAFDLIIAEANA